MKKFLTVTTFIIFLFQGVPAPLLYAVPSGLGEDSRFGIDYVFPLDPQYHQKPYAERLGETAAGWVNFADVRWQWIEPKPPVGGRQHRYQWNKLDRAIQHWQSKGFHIVISLRLGSGWFAGPIKYEPQGLPPLVRRMIKDSDRLPEEAYIPDYEQWIKSFVERYDGDGVRDMPGLRFPVLHYQIGNEYGNPAYFTGTIEDYIRMLRLASAAARTASPNVKIIPNGLRMNDFFHKDPSAAHLEQTLSRFYEGLPQDFFRVGWKRSLELDERVLSLKGVFNIVDAGGNGSWHTTSEGYYRWVRRILEKADNIVPIWDMESRCEPLLTPIKTTHAHMELAIPNGKAIAKQMKNKSSPGRERVVTWYRQEQARALAKVFVTRFGAGYEKVFIGMPIDWDRGIGALSWPNPFVGLLSSECQPWPAYHTLKFLVNELDGFSKAKRLDAPARVSLFRFDFSDGRKTVWMAWLEEDGPRGLDQALPERQVVLSGVLATSAQEIPANEETVPAKDFQTTPQGCGLLLTPTPVALK